MWASAIKNLLIQRFDFTNVKEALGRDNPLSLVGLSRGCGGVAELGPFFLIGTFRLLAKQIKGMSWHFN